MPTIIATPGAVDANSYETLVEAQAYFDAHLYASAWASADQATKEKALIMAARLLDAWFEWTGGASTSTQALGWPRTGMLSRNGYEIADDAIPQDLKNAQSEFALGLIGANLAQNNSVADQGITEVKAGPVAVKFKEAIERKVVPDVVRELIPPSWYEGGVDEGTDLVFEVL
jgi:hypothetical protein